jgi:hypothetical protein
MLSLFSWYQPWEMAMNQDREQFKQEVERVYARLHEQEPDMQRCECCGRELNKKRIAYLELSFRTGKWYAPGECPENESQGCFPFGIACANNTLNQERDGESR